MSQDAIQRLLEGRYPDPDGGGVLRVPTRAVVIGDSLAGDVAELVRRLDLGRTFAVVSDSVTHGVLGARVERALGAPGPVTSALAAAFRDLVRFRFRLWRELESEEKAVKSATSHQ